MDQTIKSELLCRSCLEVLSEDVLASDKYDIFSTIELAFKFEACTALTVAVTDEFSDYLCESCYNKVLDFYEFRIMCRDSVQRFRELRNASNMISFEDVKPVFEQEAESKEDEIVTNDEIDVLNVNTVETVRKRRGRPRKVKIEAIEEICHKPNEDSIVQPPPIILENMDEEAKSSAESVQLDDEEFALSKKSQKLKKRTCNEKTKTVLSKSVNMFECDICPKRFFVEHRLAGHKRRHDGLVPYPCTELGCDKGFQRWDTLTVHLKEHEGTSTLFTCQQEGCGKAFKHKPTLNMHMRKSHQMGPALKTHVCEICGKIFKLLAILNHHRYTHKEKSELPFKCEQPDCKRSFSKKEKLKEHMLRHAGIKNFVCPHCGMRKTTRNELRTHINYHTLERTWSCRFCAKVFNSTGNLKRHIRTVHECAKDYACSYCDRTFAKPDTRKYHEMTHTGEKPNECEECGKRFIQPTALRTHQKVHLKYRSQAATAKVSSANAVD